MMFLEIKTVMLLMSEIGLDQVGDLAASVKAWNMNCVKK